MKFVLLLLCLLAFVTGCDSGPVGPANSNNNSNPGCLDPSPSFWLALYDVTQPVHGYCETALRRRMNADSWTDDYISTAEFCSAKDKAAAVEYLLVNGIQLQGDTSLYLSVDKLPFNTYHVWSFGGGDVPATYDSILAPNAFSVTSPLCLADTVSKKGFSVIYERPGTDSVQISFIYDPNLSREYDPTVTDSAYYVALPSLFKATGLANIPTATLSGSLFSPAFPDKGIVRMFIVAYRKKLITSGGKKYLLRSGVLTESAFFIRK